MVYNRDSVWLHLYTAYERMIIEGAFPGLDIHEAFAPQHRRAGVPDLACYARGGLPRAVPAWRASTSTTSAATYRSTSCRRSSARGRTRSPTRGSTPSTATFLRELTFDFAG